MGNLAHGQEETMEGKQFKSSSQEAILGIGGKFDKHAKAGMDGFMQEKNEITEKVDPSSTKFTEQEKTRLKSNAVSG